MRTAEGPVADPSGPGRGAYVHPDEVCVESALKNGLLTRALRARVGPDELGRLGDILRTGSEMR
ncbi:MAG: YlxR family protein [Actinomycetota bacterium]|nr:YlxR family protein [Actinomycetota bacterium]